MLLFGHTGITVGIIKACDILINRPLNNYKPDSSSGFSPITSKKPPRLYYRLNRIKRRLGSIDYRLVLLGSLLPDILDKPLWLFAFSDIFPSGRDYAHTFLFNLVLFICGLILFRYKKTWLLIISLCSIIHLILDQIWDNPTTLWWPILGAFDRVETTTWLPNIIHELPSDPSAYIFEIIGLVIIVLLSYRLIARRNTINFIRNGTVD